MHSGDSKSAVYEQELNGKYFILIQKRIQTNCQNLRHQKQLQRIRIKVKILNREE